MYINIVLNILRVKFQMEGGKMAQEDPGWGEKIIYMGEFSSEIYNGEKVEKI